jgi:hypothetical protein
VTFQLEASQRVRDGTRDQPVTDVHGFSFNYDNSQKEQKSSIAIGRQRRQIGPPQKYAMQIW